MHRFGTFIRDAPNIINSEIDRIKDLGINTVQLQIYPFYNDLTIYDKFKKKLELNKIICIIHSSYMIKLSNIWDKYSWWIILLIEEIKLAHKLNSKFIIIHINWVNRNYISKKQAYNNMYSALLYIHNQTINYKSVKIVLETPGGQKNEICYKLEDLAYFFNKFSNNKNNSIKKRFRICIDTCHIFSAGYDLRTKKNIDNYINIFDKLIGLKYISVIHLNDSKTDFNSRVDRHESLGMGYIGEEGLKYFATYFKKLNIPIILETSFKYHKYEINNYLL